MPTTLRASAYHPEDEKSNPVYPGREEKKLHEWTVASGGA
jgi:hypothetical protein